MRAGCVAALRRLTPPQTFDEDLLGGTSARLELARIQLHRRLRDCQRKLLWLALMTNHHRQLLVGHEHLRQVEPASLHVHAVISEQHVSRNDPGPLRRRFRINRDDGRIIEVLNRISLRSEIDRAKSLLVDADPALGKRRGTRTARAVPVVGIDGINASIRLRITSASAL